MKKRNTTYIKLEKKEKRGKYIYEKLMNNLRT